MCAITPTIKPIKQKKNLAQMDKEYNYCRRFVEIQKQST